MVQPWCRPAGPCLTFITPCRPDPCGRPRRDHQKKGRGGSRQQPLPTSLPRFPPSHLVSLSESQPTSSREPWGRGGCVKESGFRLRSSRSSSPGPGTPRNCPQIRRGREVSSPQAASGQLELKKARDKTKQSTPNQMVTLATRDYRI